jgi:hypothetical protein
VGFFPAQDPKYVLLVAIDEPKKDTYASLTAAPLFSELGTFVVRKEAIKPSEPEVWKHHLSNQIRLNKQLANHKRPEPESVTGMPLSEALEYLRSFEVPLRVKGQGDTVTKVEAELNAESNEPESITITIE